MELDLEFYHHVFTAHENKLSYVSEKETERNRREQINCASVKQQTSFDQDKCAKCTDNIVLLVDYGATTSPLVMGAFRHPASPCTPTRHSYDEDGLLIIPCAGVSSPNFSQSPSPVAVGSQDILMSFESQKSSSVKSHSFMLAIPPLDDSPQTPQQQQQELPCENLLLLPKLQLRRLPKMCAICLDEYHENEKVTWSSNPLCQDVFHQECILDWLVTNERANQLDVQRHRKEAKDAMLSCPCCRQNFMNVKSLGLEKAGGDEMKEDDVGSKNDDGIV